MTRTDLTQLHDCLEVEHYKNEIATDFSMKSKTHFMANSDSFSSRSYKNKSCID